MDNKSNEMEQLLQSEQAQNLLKDKRAIKALLESEETKRLMALFQSSAGGNLKQAAQSAVKGDPGQLKEVMSRVLNSQEGGDLARKLREKAEKK